MRSNTQHRQYISQGDLCAGWVRINHRLGTTVPGFDVIDNTGRVVSVDRVSHITLYDYEIDLSSHTPITGTWTVVTQGAPSRLTTRQKVNRVQERLMDMCSWGAIRNIDQLTGFLKGVGAYVEGVEGLELVSVSRTTEWDNIDIQFYDAEYGEHMMLRISERLLYMPISAALPDRKGGGDPIYDLMRDLNTNQKAPIIPNELFEFEG